MKDILLKIQEFADNAHGEQMRKYTTERYIVHPIKVMKICEMFTEKIEVLAAALLHDVLEDTPVSEKDILSFLETVMTKDQANNTLKLVIELTDVYTKEAYPHLNRKLRKEKETERLTQTSADAQTIKYADILDNSKEILVMDRYFAPRFLKECLAILKATHKGNQELYNLTLETVQAGLKSLKKG